MDPEVRISRRVLLLILIAVDCVLLAIGVTGTTKAPRSVVSVGDGNSRTTLLMPEKGPTLVLEEDRANKQSRVGVLEIAPLAAARLDGRTYLFDERGISRVTQRVESDPGAEIGIEDFQEYPERFIVDGVTADVALGRVVAIGFDSAGALTMLIHDGARTTRSALQFPPGCTELGGERGGVRAAICALGADRMLLAVRDSKNLFLAEHDAKGLHYGGAIALDDPLGRPEIVRDGARLACYQVEGNSSEAHRLRSFTLRSGAGIDEPLVASMDLESGTRAIGLIATGAEPEHSLLLIAKHDRLSSLSFLADGAEDSSDAIDFVVVAWNSQEARFANPLVLHLIFYGLLGVLARRRPSLEPRVVIYRPAPLLRRLFAALCDLSIVVFATWFTFSLANGSAETAYFAARTDAIGALALTTNSIELLNQDPIFASLFLDYAFLGLFLITMIHAFSDALFGRTLGKMLFRLRVMSLDGEAPSIGAVVTRALLMVVDFMVYTPLVGISFILFSKRRQRLGDLFSGSVVVEDKSVSVRRPTTQEVERATK